MLRESTFPPGVSGAWTLHFLPKGIRHINLFLVPSPSPFLDGGADDEALFLGPDTLLSGQSAQQWKLRIAAQAAAPKGGAGSKLRRLGALNKSFNCTGAQAGDFVLFYNASNRRSTPRRRGPAKAPDIDEAGVTVKFRSQTYKTARVCVTKKADAPGAGAVDWSPASGGSDSWDGTAPAE